MMERWGVGEMGCWEIGLMESWDNGLKYGIQGNSTIFNWMRKFGLKSPTKEQVRENNIIWHQTITELHTELEQINIDALCGLFGKSRQALTCPECLLYTVALAW
jgi:hypothetical protein